MNGWRIIATAPKDGTEILGWRDDAGAMLMRWTAPEIFLNEAELEKFKVDEMTAQTYSWWFADFIEGGNLSDSGEPTHWQPLPGPPNPN